MASKRTKEPDEIITVGQGIAAYINEDTSVEAMAEHRVLPRIKVIQGLTRDKGGLEDGTVILVPGNGFIAALEKPFEFVPLFFYEEFIAWNDLADTASFGIHERSLTKTSTLAKKCQNPDTWIEEYPGGSKAKPFRRRYVASLNFACIIDMPEHVLNGIACVLTFQRGEFSKGRRFISAVQMRRFEGRQVPLWATRWSAASALRTKAGNSWYGLNIENAAQPYILDADADAFRAQFLGLKDAHSKMLLQTDYSDGDVPLDSEETGAGEFS